MVEKTKFLYIAFAIILVFLFIGMPPLNLAHKLSSGCLFDKSKPNLKGASSFRYSLPSPNDMNAVIPPSSEPGNQMVPSWDSALLNPTIIPSDSLLKPLPMRCWFFLFSQAVFCKSINPSLNDVSPLIGGTDRMVQLPVREQVDSGFQNPFAQRGKEVLSNAQSFFSTIRREICNRIEFSRTRSSILYCEKPKGSFQPS